eukprot:TRINITY_DN2680_c4_g1_i1.p1 TRINITY_DN2680_c4_g1~~TRINITY_DN2680_c4_g1_i1.p1  ORF type:complete len:300 (+),score=92.33 TRINITY_DN2680_c4_g1_i1:53-901(+)
MSSASASDSYFGTNVIGQILDMVEKRTKEGYQQLANRLKVDDKKAQPVLQEGLKQIQGKIQESINQSLTVFDVYAQQNILKLPSDYSQSSSSSSSSSSSPSSSSSLSSSSLSSSTSSSSESKSDLTADNEIQQLQKELASLQALTKAMTEEDNKLGEELTAYQNLISQASLSSGSSPSSFSSASSSASSLDVSLFATSLKDEEVLTDKLAQVIAQANSLVDARDALQAASSQVPLPGSMGIESSSISGLIVAQQQDSQPTQMSDIPTVALKTLNEDLRSGRV